MRVSLLVLVLLASPLALAQQRLAWDPGAASFTLAVPEVDFSTEVVVAEIDADGGVNLPLIYDDGQRLTVEMRGALGTLRVAPEVAGRFDVEVAGMPSGAAFVLSFSPPAEVRFNEAYRQRYGGVSRMVVPEVYELVHVVLALTPTGRDTTNGLVAKRGAYYDAVLDQFGAYAEHPAVATFEAVLQADELVGVRSNALAFQFDGDALVGDSTYVSLGRGHERLAELLPALEDFAQASGFRAFYAAHADAYAALVREMEALVPVPQMWAWLEAEFPDRSQSYLTVFSPLTGWTHNAKTLQDSGHRESIGFVAGPGILDDGELVVSHDMPAWREIEMSRIAFTEYDHTYVNPVMDEVGDEISLAMADQEAWNGSGDYASSYNTFAEYMTWAALLLYVDAHYPADVATGTRAGVVRFMERGRGFWRFGAFLDAATVLYGSRAEGETLAALMPRLARWAARQ